MTNLSDEEQTARIRRELEEARVLYDNKFQLQCRLVREAENAVKQFQAAEKRLLKAELVLCNHLKSVEGGDSVVDAVIDATVNEGNTNEAAELRDVQMSGGDERTIERQNDCGKLLRSTDAMAADNRATAANVTSVNSVGVTVSKRSNMTDLVTPAKSRLDDEELLGTLDFVSPAPLQMLGSSGLDDISESNSRLTGTYPVGVTSVVIAEDSKIQMHGVDDRNDMVNNSGGRRASLADEEDGIVPATKSETTPESMFYDLTPVDKAKGGDENRGFTTPKSERVVARRKSIASQSRDGGKKRENVLGEMNEKNMANTCSSASKPPLKRTPVKRKRGRKAKNETDMKKTPLKKRARPVMDDVPTDGSHPPPSPPVAAAASAVVVEDKKQKVGRRSRRARKTVSYNYDGPRSDIIVTDADNLNDVDWDELKVTLPRNRRVVEASARKKRRVSSAL